MTEELPDPTVPTNEGGGGTGGSNNGTVVNPNPAPAEHSTIAAAIAANTTGILYITPGVYTESVINFPNTYKWTIYAYGATIVAQFISDNNTTIEVFGGQFVYTRQGHLERQYYNFDLGTGSTVTFHNSKLRCTSGDVGIINCVSQTFTFNNCEFYSDWDTIVNNGGIVTLNNCSMIGSSVDTYYMYLDSSNTTYIYNTAFTSTAEIGSIQFNAGGPSVIYAYNSILPELYTQGAVDMRLYNSVIPLVSNGAVLTGNFICDNCTIDRIIFDTLETGYFTNCTITTIDGTTGRNLSFTGCKINYFRIANNGVSNTVVNNCEVNSNLILTAIDIGLVLQNCVMNSTSVITGATGACKIYGCTFMNDVSMQSVTASSVDNCVFRKVLYHSGGVVDISNCTFNRIAGTCLMLVSYNTPSIVTVNNCSFTSDDNCIDVSPYFASMTAYINHCNFLNISGNFCVYVHRVFSTGVITITDCSMNGTVAGIHHDDGSGNVVVNYSKNTMTGGGVGYEGVEGSISSTVYVAF